MATNVTDDSNTLPLPIDPRATVIVKGVAYYAKTDMQCPTCTGDKKNSPLYVKMRIQQTTMLECPNCSAIVSVPSGSFKEV